MAKKSVKLSQTEKQSLESVELTPQVEGVESLPVEQTPLQTDPGWSDYVTSHFQPGELDPDGRPLVHGLRRVAELLVGTIVRCETEVVQAPSFVPERAPMMQPAVVRNVIVVRVDDETPWEKTFSEVADVYFGNVDPNFVRFPTATASTRAEARNLRKILRLRGCAAEEMTSVPAAEAATDGLITPTQISFLNVLCRRLDVDAMAFVNSGRKKYESVLDVPYPTAQLMVERLSGYQTDPTRIPSEQKGFRPDWLEGEKK